MKTAILLIFLCCILSISCYSLNFQGRHGIYNCRSNMYPPPNKTFVPGPFYVNLADSPETRWKPVVEPLKQEIKEMIDVVVEYLDIVAGRDWLVNFVLSTAPKLLATLPDELQREIRGIASVTGIQLGKIVLLNFAYDAFDGCTSIIAQETNGLQYHARNLDFGSLSMWDPDGQTWKLTEKLRKIVVNVNFLRGCGIPYSGTFFAGYVGILTGVKSDSFTLSINMRDRSLKGWMKRMDDLVNQSPSSVTRITNLALTREIFEKADTYEEAKARLQTAHLFSPVYFILGGLPGDGCVITRSMDETVDVWEMAKIPEHPWFILETNTDHWKNPPKWDDRQHPGEYCMQHYGNGAVNPQNLFNVLSTGPVRNEETVFTAIMNVQGGSIESYVQYCDVSCRIN